MPPVETRRGMQLRVYSMVRPEVAFRIGRPAHSVHLCGGRTAFGCHAREDGHGHAALIARSNDLCLFCTVHAYDGRTGRELARFRFGEMG